MARILEDDLGLLLRGEVIWQKARGAAGNCAWGTYQKPGDPVLRDLTERVVIASKGRFDRAIAAPERARRGYPSEATISRDEFLEATVDVWESPPRAPRGSGTPPPSPSSLPQRFIDLYTYRGDLVVDPFVGSGTTAVAALRTERHFVGYDTDPGYVAEARARAEAEARSLKESAAERPGRPLLPAVPGPADPEEHYQARGMREGRRARELAKWALEDSGFSIESEGQRLEGGAEVDFVAATGPAGNGSSTSLVPSPRPGPAWPVPTYCGSRSARRPCCTRLAREPAWCCSPRTNPLATVPAPEPSTLSQVRGGSCTTWSASAWPQTSNA